MQTSIYRMDKQDVVHIYNGVLLSHKKEWSNGICSNMDGSRNYLKWSQSDNETQISHAITYNVNLQKRIHAEQKQTHWPWKTYGYQGKQVVGERDGLGVWDGNVLKSGCDDGCMTINTIKNSAKCQKTKDSKK